MFEVTGSIVLQFIRAEQKYIHWLIYYRNNYLDKYYTVNTKLSDM